MASKNKPKPTKGVGVGVGEEAGKRTKTSKKASSTDCTTAEEDSILGMLYQRIRRTYVQLWFDVDTFTAGYLVVCKRKFVHIIVAKELQGQDHEDMFLVFSNGQKIIPTKIRSQTFDGFTAFRCSRFMDSQVIDKSAVDVIKFCSYGISCHEKVYHYTHHVVSGELITEGNVIKSEDGRFEHNCAAGAYSKDGVVINKEGELVGICDYFDGYQSCKRAAAIAQSLAGFRNISKHVALLPEPSGGYSPQTQESDDL